MSERWQKTKPFLHNIENKVVKLENNFNENTKKKVAELNMFSFGMSTLKSLPR